MVPNLFHGSQASATPAPRPSSRKDSSNQENFRKELGRAEEPARDQYRSDRSRSDSSATTETRKEPTTETARTASTDSQPHKEAEASSSEEVAQTNTPEEQIPTEDSQLEETDLTAETPIIIVPQANELMLETVDSTENTDAEAVFYTSQNVDHNLDELMVDEELQPLQNVIKAGGAAGATEILSTQNVETPIEENLLRQPKNDILQATQTDVPVETKSFDPRFDPRQDVDPLYDLASRPKISSEVLLGEAATKLDQKDVLMATDPIERAPEDALKEKTDLTNFINRPIPEDAPAETIKVQKDPFPLQEAASIKPEELTKQVQDKKSLTESLFHRQSDDNAVATETAQKTTENNFNTVTAVSSLVSQDILKPVDAEKKAKPVMATIAPTEAMNSPEVSSTANHQAEMKLAEATTNTVSSTNTSSSAFQAESGEFNPQQIWNQMQRFRNDKNQEIVMRLDPEHLGKLTMRMRESADGMVVDMRVESTMAKQLIESNIATLQSRFFDEDMTLSQMNVTVDSEQQSLFSDSQQSGNSEAENDFAGESQNDRLEAGVESDSPVRSLRDSSGLSLYA